MKLTGTIKCLDKLLIITLVWVLLAPLVLGIAFLLAYLFIVLSMSFVGFMIMVVMAFLMAYLCDRYQTILRKNIKKIVLATGYICSVLGLYFFLNSNWLIIKLGEREFADILQMGTPRQDIIQFIQEKGYYFSERSIIGYGDSMVNSDGKCIYYMGGDSKWLCQYAGNIFTRRRAGFLGITDPSFRLEFAYDKQGRLVKYDIDVGHTFL